MWLKSGVIARSIGVQTATMDNGTYNHPYFFWESAVLPQQMTWISLGVPFSYRCSIHSLWYVKSTGIVITHMGCKITQKVTVSNFCFSVIYRLYIVYIYNDNDIENNNWAPLLVNLIMVWMGELSSCVMRHVSNTSVSHVQNLESKWFTYCVSNSTHIPNTLLYNYSRKSHFVLEPKSRTCHQTRATTSGRTPLMRGTRSIYPSFNSWLSRNNLGKHAQDLSIFKI